MPVPPSLEIEDDSPTKRLTTVHDKTSSEPLPVSISRSLDFQDASFQYEAIEEDVNVPSHDGGQNAQSVHERTKARTLSEGSIDLYTHRDATKFMRHVFDQSETLADLTAQRRFRHIGGEARQPFRHRSASSPLRSSQWKSRGGLLLSPRRGQSSTPDRFIPARRPPAITRESYETSKPRDRLEQAQTSHTLIGARGNPFSRRLPRSAHLNNELRNLREAHSVIMSRASAHRRNTSLNFQRELFANARDISTGAVWNVGGPSAVSDTVVGVPTGRGGMLGSGTVAPLYTSSFLNRADPQAELEAYERRLAFALDINQLSRILLHVPQHAASSQWSSCSRSKPRAYHVWRDCAWTRDSSSSRKVNII